MSFLNNRTLLFLGGLMAYKFGKFSIIGIAYLLAGAILSIGYVLSKIDEKTMVLWGFMLGVLGITFYLMDKDTK